MKQDWTSHKKCTQSNWQFDRFTIEHVHKINILKSDIQRKIIITINSQSAKCVIGLRYIFSQSNYLISTVAAAFLQSGTILFDPNIFTVINDLKKKRKRADIDGIRKEILKTIDFNRVSTNVPLLHPRKTSKNRKFSDV